VNDLRVKVPDRPPTLTPAAARILLEILGLASTTHTDDSSVDVQEQVTGAA